MKKDEIRVLLNDLENDRVERTISTTNTDKFGQAICAFANDLPNHQLPGYLFLGVKDNGEVQGLNVTDDLLKNVAAIRTDGNIQPQPSMTVEKVTMEEGDIVVVKVEPSVFPPVRYKGRIWVRIGPRKGVANEEDERILMEKRRTNVSSFDSSPCLNATMDDLNLNQFKHYFLPKAMKVLGFVNRHSRGVLRVQKDLKANENGEAVYDFGYQTAVLVKENKSPLGERMMADAIANGFLLENGEKRSDVTTSEGGDSQKGSQKQTRKQTRKQTKNPSRLKIPEFPTPLVEEIYKAIKLNPRAKYSWLADNLGVNERTVQRAIADLKRLGYINSEHSKIKGEWQLLK